MSFMANCAKLLNFVWYRDISIFLLCMLVTLTPFGVLQRIIYIPILDHYFGLTFFLAMLINLLCLMNGGIFKELIYRRKLTLISLFFLFVIYRSLFIFEVDISINVAFQLTGYFITMLSVASLRLNRTETKLVMNLFSSKQVPLLRKKCGGSLSLRPTSQHSGLCSRPGI